MPHYDKITLFKANGTTEEHKWDVSDHIDKDEAEMFDALGYSASFDLGNESLLFCSVYKHRKDDKWVFSVFDFGVRILLVLTEDPMAFTRYLKEISETCLAAHEASAVYDKTS